MSDENMTLQVESMLRRLQQGDADARGCLLALAHRRFETLARQMLRGYAKVRAHEETNDVLQNALIRLDRALAEVAPATPRDFYRLATLQIRRELTDLARHWTTRHGMKRSADLAPVDAQASASPDASDLTHEPHALSLWAEFHEAVAALPDEERDVFQLLWYQELPQADAAELLGISISGLKRRWLSSRRILFEKLGGNLPF